MTAKPDHSAESVAGDRPRWETCSLCNYDRHRCPGCGTDVPHGTIACDECNQMADLIDGPVRPPSDEAERTGA
jgi:hypothetical protein